MKRALASAKRHLRSDRLAKRCIGSLRFAFFVTAGSCPAASYGQTAATQQSFTGEENEAIIVTAQRRPERAEDVPISLTARSGEELERLQATDTTSLDRVVSSLVM